MASVRIVPGSKHKSEETIMTNQTFTSFRSIVSALAAIALTALIATSFIQSTHSVQWLGSSALTEVTA